MSGWFHETAIVTLQGRYADLRVKGFRKTLCSSLRYGGVCTLCGEPPEEQDRSCKCLRFFRVRPDAFMATTDDNGVTWSVLFEVEDTHQIGVEKMGQYLDLWWKLDALADHDLALVTVDRYGREKAIDLAALALADICLSRSAEAEQ